MTGNTQAMGGIFLRGKKKVTNLALHSKTLTRRQHHHYKKKQHKINTKAKARTNAKRKVQLRSRLLYSLVTKVRLRVVAPAHPLVVKIGCIQFERLFTFLSLQTSFERVIGQRLQPKVTAIIRGQVCPSSNK